MAPTASSFPQNHVETEIKTESPLFGSAFTATEAFPRAAVPCTSTAASSIGTSSSGAADPGISTSSSEAADPGISNCSQYAAFVNHFGEDVKNTFASHLYHRLKLEGIRTFLDRHELPKGKNFPDQITDAIQNALCHVAIISPRYTESEWVLNELLHMLDTGADIIPVFYKVNPDELARASSRDGIFAPGLQKLEMQMTRDPQTHEEKQRFSSSTIADWIKALHKVAENSGFKLDDYNSDEGILLEKVVEAVKKRIKETGLYVAEYPTGLDVKVKDFEARVTLQSGKPQVVGIVGMCGIGKTTLALELFNGKRSDYDRSYFLSDISENASKMSLCVCQSELLKGLTQRDFHIGNVFQGMAMLKKQLSGFNTFIVLDGIHHASHMDAFLPVVNVLGSSSLILITCRDRNVLTGSGVQNTSIYKLTGLDAHYSRQLFCSHAFGHSHPLPEFESLVEKFSEACEGSPLLLKLSGKHVCGKNDRLDWEDQFGRLQQILLHDIRDRLKSSWDALHTDEKYVFLDTACFFEGERAEMAIRFWDALGLKGSLVFQNLENKSLVEVDSEGKIKMNILVRDRGREIAKSPGLPLRLLSQKQVDDLLQESYGRTEVRGIRMRTDDDDTDSDGYSAEISCYGRLSSKLFCNCAVKRCNSGATMRNVQFFDTEGFQLERIWRRVYSPNPIWLRLSKCPYHTLPSWVRTENLRVLQLSGYYLERLWRDKSQAPLLLRELVVDAPLSKLPKSFVLLEHLKRIVLKNNNLKSLPELFGNLKELEHLDLSHSRYLQKLPNSFGRLTQLKHFNLSCCFSLRKLPDSIGNLRNLQHLNVSSSQSLQGLPNSFSELVQLKHLDLSNSSSLQKLPDSIGNLRNLQHLNVSSSQSLQGLPDSFSELVQLKHLDLSNSSSLQKLPDSIGNLRNLQHLNVSSSQSLQGLPNSFGELVQLKHLDLSNSSSLQRLPNSFANLIQLEFLNLDGCLNLTVSRETLPDIDPSFSSLSHCTLI